MTKNPIQSLNLEYYGTSEANVKHSKTWELNQFSGELLENQ